MEQAYKKTFAEALKKMGELAMETQEAQAAPRDDDYRGQRIEGGEPRPRLAPIPRMFQEPMEEGRMYEVDEEDRQRARENMPIGVRPGETVAQAQERVSRQPQSVNSPLGNAAGTQFDRIETAPTQRIQMQDAIQVGADPRGDELDLLMEDIEALPPSESSEAPSESAQMENPFERTDADKQAEQMEGMQDEQSWDRLTNPSQLMENATYRVPREANQSLENLMATARRVIPSSRR